MAPNRLNSSPTCPTRPAPGGHSLDTYITKWLNSRKVKQRMSTDPLSTIFAALADPTRRTMLARLASGEASVSELAEPFPMSMPAISKHLKVLERAGLIAKSREAQWRLCRLEGAPLREVAGWMEPYRRFWDESFSRLDEHLLRMQEERMKKEKEKPT